MARQSGIMFGQFDLGLSLVGIRLNQIDTYAGSNLLLDMLKGSHNVR
jgi:hypothetical protein